jgi:hypothetical protein
MWFCVDSCGDVSTFDTPEKARKAAEDALQSERDVADEGWCEEVTNIMWGKVLGTCELEFSRPRTDDDHFVSSCCDEVCDYHIVDVDEPEPSKHPIGYFESLRQSHPIRHGSVVDGKRVVMTAYQNDADGNGSYPVYQLEGESCVRRCN